MQKHGRQLHFLPIKSGCDHFFSRKKQSHYGYACIKKKKKKKDEEVVFGCLKSEDLGNAREKRRG